LVKNAIGDLKKKFLGGKVVSKFAFTDLFSMHLSFRSIAGNDNEYFLSESFYKERESVVGIHLLLLETDFDEVKELLTSEDHSVQR
jgi:hypothetical protein